MPCLASTNSGGGQALPPLPTKWPSSQAEWTLFIQRAQARDQAIASGLISLGVNVIPSPLTVFDAITVPPSRVTGATASLSATARFGTSSLRLTATAATVVLTLGTSGYPIPIAPNGQWIGSTYVQTSGTALAGTFAIVTPAATYNQNIGDSVQANTWNRLYDTFNPQADASTSCTITLTFTGCTVGQTIDLEGFMLETTDGYKTLPSVFQVSSPPRTWTDIPDPGTKPANNADVTAANTALDTANVAGTPAATVVNTANTAIGQVTQLPVINGGFDIAPTGYGWAADGGTWSVDTTSISPGIQPNCARRNGNSTTPTDVYRNSGRMGVDVGQIVRAQGLIKAVGADGSCAVRISWLDANQLELSDTQGNTVTGTTTAGSYVVGAAPANARYARVELIANLNTVGYYLADNVLVTQYPKNISEVPNGGGHNSVTGIDGNGLALIDFTQAGHVSKNVDNLADGTTYGRTVNSYLNGNRPRMDFGDTWHSNKNLDYISDTASWARPKAGALQAGVIPPAAYGKNLVANPSFALNVTGNTYGTSIPSNGTICDGWKVANTGMAVLSLESATSAPIVGIHPYFSFRNNTLPANTLSFVSIEQMAANRFACSPGQVFRMEANFITSTNIPSPPVGRTLRVDIYWYDGNGTFLSETQNDVAADMAYDVQVVTGDFTAPANAAYGGAVIALYMSNATASPYTFTTYPFDLRVTYVGVYAKSSLDYEVTDGTTYGRTSQSDLYVSGGVNRVGLRISGSGQRIGDQRNLLQRTITNYPANIPTSITYSSTTTSATISIAAFTVLAGSISVSYNAMSVSTSGTAGTTVTYFLYFNDPTYAGGTQTLIATTNYNDIYAGDGYVYAGKIAVVYPASGTSGGGGTCVCDDMFIDDSRTAGDARPGDVFDCLDLPITGMRKFRRRLHSVEHAIVPCVRITTDAGAILGCSTTTPFDVLDGRTVYAPAMLGEKVVTDKGVETVARVDDIGERRVCHIHLGGVSYAAGADPVHRIYSHNLKP